jgi:hypothetical protein
MIPRWLIDFNLRGNSALTRQFPLRRKFARMVTDLPVALIRDIDRPLCKESRDRNGSGARIDDRPVSGSEIPMTVLRR